jgi:chromosome segregation ATPase
LRHKDAVLAIRTAHEALLDVQIRIIEAKSDVQALKDKNADITQQLDEKKAELRQVEQSLEGLRNEAGQALRAAEEVMANAEVKEHLEDLARDKTVEFLDGEIGAERSKLDVIQASNPNALAEFERRAAEIERLQRKKAQQESELGELDEQIADLRERWEPRLDELVGKINGAFSYNFEQINCAGEVGVHKDEDFDKWAIEIKVKFRCVFPRPFLSLPTTTTH